MEVLRWVPTHRCHWDSDSCGLAAKGGHLQVLKRARAHGCPRNANSCAQVAEARGHVEVAQWVRAQPP